MPRKLDILSLIRECAVLRSCELGFRICVFKVFDKIPERKSHGCFAKRSVADALRDESVVLCCVLEDRMSEYEVINMGRMLL